MDTESGAASREGAIRRQWEERTRVTLAQEEEEPECTDHRWGGSTWERPGLSLCGFPLCPQHSARPGPARGAATVVNKWLGCRVKGKYYELGVRTLGTPPCAMGMLMPSRPASSPISSPPSHSTSCTGSLCVDAQSLCYV